MHYLYYYLLYKFRDENGDWCSPNLNREKWGQQNRKTNKNLGTLNILGLGSKREELVETMEKTKLKCWDWQIKDTKGKAVEEYTKDTWLSIQEVKTQRMELTNSHSLHSLACTFYIFSAGKYLSCLAAQVSRNSLLFCTKSHTQKITCCFNDEHQPNNPSIIHHFTKLTLEHNSQHNSHPWFSDNSATSQSNINQLLTHVVSLHFQYNIHWIKFWRSNTLSVVCPN